MKKELTAAIKGLKLRRGFAVMDTYEVSRIASLGGKAVSKNRKHMAEIGSAGGKNSHKGNGQ